MIDNGERKVGGKVTKRNTVVTENSDDNDVGLTSGGVVKSIGMCGNITNGNKVVAHCVDQGDERTAKGDDLIGVEGIGGMCGGSIDDDNISNFGNIANDNSIELDIGNAHGGGMKI